MRLREGVVLYFLRHILCGNRCWDVRDACGALSWHSIENKWYKCYSKDTASSAGSCRFAPHKIFLSYMPLSKVFPNSGVLNWYSVVFRSTDEIWIWLLCRGNLSTKQSITTLGNDPRQRVIYWHCSCSQRCFQVLCERASAGLPSMHIKKILGVQKNFFNVKVMSKITIDVQFTSNALQSPQPFLLTDYLVQQVCNCSLFTCVT